MYRPIKLTDFPCTLNVDNKRFTFLVSLTEDKKINANYYSDKKDEVLFPDLTAYSNLQSALDALDESMCGALLWDEKREERDSAYNKMEEKFKSLVLKNGDTFCGATEINTNCEVCIAGSTLDAVMVKNGELRFVYNENEDDYDYISEFELADLEQCYNELLTYVIMEIRDEVES